MELPLTYDTGSLPEGDKDSHRENFSLRAVDYQEFFVLGRGNDMIRLCYMNSKLCTKMGGYFVSVEESTNAFNLGNPFKSGFCKKAGSVFNAFGI